MTGLRNVTPFLLLVFGGIFAYRLFGADSGQSSEILITFLKPVLVPLVELISKPAFVYNISFLIVVAALAVCAAYWHRVVHRQVRRLTELRSAIDELPVPMRWDPELCASVMHRAGDALRKADLFLSAWAMFQSQRQREGIIPAAPFGYFAASDPSIDEDKSGGFMQSMPSYFISVGLIFTFIGLVVALYFAGRGFRSGNIEEARASILQLFNASSFKFLTSVAALFSSLLISVVFRYSKSRLRDEIERTITRIEAFIGPWRELEPTLATRPTSSDLAHRIDVLISSIDALSANLAGFLDRIDQRGSEIRRDAAE
jgi:hypothetical protein